MADFLNKTESVRKETDAVYYRVYSGWRRLDVRA